MNEKLLNEFIIEEYGHGLIFSVTPTDKAYELLGLNEKVVISCGGYARDTIDKKYYRTALLHFLNNNYTIEAFARTASGNGCNKKEHIELTILDDNKTWKHEIQRLKTTEAGRYNDSPIVREIGELTPEIMSQWGYEYGTCGERIDGRYVLCSDESGKVRYFFGFGTSYVVSRANSKVNEIEKPQEYRTSGIYLKCETECLDI